MIVRDEDKEVSPSESAGGALYQPVNVPQSLSGLSTELQERLAQASFNQCLKSLKSALTSDPSGVEDIAVKICTINCSPAFKCRHLKLWSLFHHNCKVRITASPLTNFLVEYEIFRRWFIHIYFCQTCYLMCKLSSE